MQELRQKTITGIGWSIASQIGGQVLRFAVFVALARVLSPREFGLIAMITVMTGFASLFVEMGFGAALIQKKSLGQDHLSSTFWLNLGIGFLVMAIFMAGSPLVAGFYGEPLLKPLTMLISANFLITSFSVVQHSLMIKGLDFRTLSIVDLTSNGISGILAILMALCGLGVWSLAFQSVIASLVSVFLLWKLGDWRPSFTYKLKAVKDLSGFAVNLLGTRVLNYFVRNLDNLLIGRFLGSHPLGTYNRAYALMLLPLTNMSYVISRVMFPSLSIIQEDKNRVRDIYSRMTKAIALMTFPLMSGLFVTAKPFVIGVLGQQWAEMIPVVQIFSLSGMVQSIVALTGNLFLSQGRTGLLFKIGLFLKLNAILGVVIGLHWGIVGVAMGLAIASLINTYPNLLFAGRLVNLTFSKILRDVSPIFACSVAMATLVSALGLILPSGYPHLMRLAIQVPFGMITYWVLIHVFKLRAYLDLRQIAHDQWNSRRSMVVSPLS